MFINVTACLSGTALCWSCGVINKFVLEVISDNDIIKHLPYSHMIQAHISSLWILLIAVFSAFVAQRIRISVKMV